MMLRDSGRQRDRSTNSPFPPTLILWDHVRCMVSRQVALRSQALRKRFAREHFFYTETTATSTKLAVVMSPITPNISDKSVNKRFIMRA